MVALRKLVSAPLHIARGGAIVGRCRLCGPHDRHGRPTLFYPRQNAQPDHWRESLVCIRCHGIARWRAVAAVLERVKPGWRNGRLHEAGPAGSVSAYLRRGCPGYIASHWFGDGIAPGTPAGPTSGADEVVNENLEDQSFADASFDVVITQDVLEHVFEPERALAEITRTLAPGGVHVWTIPRRFDRKTTCRAMRSDDGTIEYLQAPEYHDNPISTDGSLVVTDWGHDAEELASHWSGLPTRTHEVESTAEGVAAHPDGGAIEVFVSG